MNDVQVLIAGIIVAIAMWLSLGNTEHCEWRSSSRATAEGRNYDMWCITDDGASWERVPYDPAMEGL